MNAEEKFGWRTDDKIQLDQELEKSLPPFLQGYPVSVQTFKSDLRGILVETLDEKRKKIPDWEGRLDDDVVEQIINYWTENTELAKDKNPVLVCLKQKF